MTPTPGSSLRPEGNWRAAQDDDYGDLFLGEGGRRRCGDWNSPNYLDQTKDWAVNHDHLIVENV